MNRRDLGTMMTCKELVELVTDHLEGRMSPDEAERFDAHMEVCRPCRLYIAQMRITLSLLGHIPEETIPDAARSELLHAFGDFHSRER